MTNLQIIIGSMNSFKCYPTDNIFKNYPPEKF